MAPRAAPVQLFLRLSDDPDCPLETKPSAPRTGLLALAAAALLIGPPLYWASSADANLPLATLVSKQGAGSAGSADDGPTGGDDPDGTTAPGMTTSTDGRQGGTSRAGTSAPGVTTAPGETSEGGMQTTGACPPARADDPTTVGQDTSTAAGQETSTGGHATNTTAGETASATEFQETATVVGEQCPPPLQPPEIAPPPEQKPPEQQPPEQQPPEQQPPAQQPPEQQPPDQQPPVQQQPPGQPPAGQPPAAAPPPGAAPPPAAVPPAVLPSRVEAPIARLRAPAGCPPQVFTARVTGRSIRRVVFTVDGRRLKTLTRPDAVGVWKVRINTRNYSVGKHRLVARVTFGGVAARKASLRQGRQRVVKALTVTFSKCARKASRPKFTG
jgi:hypothetical protein